MLLSWSSCWKLNLLFGGKSFSGRFFCACSSSDCSLASSRTIRLSLSVTVALAFSSGSSSQGVILLSVWNTGGLFSVATVGIFSGTRTAVFLGAIVAFFSMWLTGCSILLVFGTILLFTIFGLFFSDLEELFAFKTESCSDTNWYWLLRGSIEEFRTFSVSSSSSSGSASSSLDSTSVWESDFKSCSTCSSLLFKQVYFIVSLLQILFANRHSNNLLDGFKISLQVKPLLHFGSDAIALFA
mmetsp:Transcript_1895/g.2371  ORF Transcript_1895/g.2371 Transcript_1895/m.2371 type:complete len:241 (-) Transcript_1895:113-835(-)